MSEFNFIALVWNEARQVWVLVAHVNQKTRLRVEEQPGFSYFLPNTKAREDLLKLCREIRQDLKSEEDWKDTKKRTREGTFPRALGGRYKVLAM